MRIYSAINVHAIRTIYIIILSILIVYIFLQIKKLKMAWTATIAEELGGSEAGLKLLLGQLAGYPLLLIHRKFLRDKPELVQHLFLMMSGLIAGHWVIGADVAHNLYCILATYLLLLVAGGTLLSVALSFVFNMGYLLAGQQIY